MNSRNAIYKGAEITLTAVYASAGLMKLSMPIEKIGNVWPWTAQVSRPFLRFIGVVDLAGALGVSLPRAMKTLPQLSRLAAFGCGVVQTFAIIFHIRRGERSSTPFNFFVLALCMLVGLRR